MTRTKRAGLLWAVASALAYAAVSLLLKVAGTALNPWLATWLRLAPLAVLVWVLPGRWWGGKPAAPQRSTLGTYVVPLVGGIIAYVGGNALFQTSLDAGLLTLVVPVTQAGTVLTATLLGRLWFKDPAVLRMWVGLAILVGGVALVAYAQDTAMRHVGGGTWALSGMMAILAGASYALANVSLRWGALHGLRSVDMARANTLGAFLILGGITLRLVVSHVSLAPPSGAAALWVLGAGVINGLAILSLIQALARWEVGPVTAVQASYVPLTTLVAEGALGEAGGVTAAAGSIVALAGAALAAWPVAQPPAGSVTGGAPVAHRG